MFPKDPCLGSHLRGWGARRVPPPPQGRRDPPALTPRSTGRRRTALEDQAGAPGRPRRAGGRAGGGGANICPAAPRQRGRPQPAALTPAETCGRRPSAQPGPASLATLFSSVKRAGSPAPRVRDPCPQEMLTSRWAVRSEQSRAQSGHWRPGCWACRTQLQRSKASSGRRPQQRPARRRDSEDQPVHPDPRLRVQNEAQGGHAGPTLRVP